MNENQNNINSDIITESKPEANIENEITPIKYIKTNRAECQHMKEDGNFNLHDFMVDDFFNNEKAIELRKHENKINEKERDKLFHNFMLVVKWLQKIPEEQEKKNNENKNLYNFFNSEEFSIDLLMVHLNKQTRISIIDTLVELMYKKYINQSFFYLPQLCMLFNYKEYYSSLESYLLDRCVNQIKFSLQITWLLNSFIEDDYSEIKLDTYESLLQRIEETLVNGERSTIKMLKQYNRNDSNSSEENNIISSKKFFTYLDKNKMSSEITPFLVKQSRLTYFDMCIDFYSSLKFMCEDLKNYKKENGERKNKLMQCIQDINDKLLKQRIDNEEFLEKYPSFFGIILPFNDTSSTEDIESNFIVRIIPEECFCFSTKARVPTKICAECITLKDLQNSDLFKVKKENKIKINSSKKNNFYLNNYNFSGKIIKRTSLKRKTEMPLNLKNICGNIMSNEIKYDPIFKRDSETIFSIKEEEDNNIEKENLQKEKLKQFLIETSKLENQRGNKNNSNKNKEENKFDINDFEILPDITEELRNVFGKPMDILEKEIKQNSPYKNFKSYKIINFIAKADDDLRQEVLAMQLIKFFDKIFKKENKQNQKVYAYFTKNFSKKILKKLKLISHVV